MMRSDNLEAPTLAELASLEVVQLLEDGAPLAWSCPRCGWHTLIREPDAWRCALCGRRALVDLAPPWDSTAYAPPDR
jgi:rubrerythrin